MPRRVWACPLAAALGVGKTKLSETVKQPRARSRHTPYRGAVRLRPSTIACTSGARSSKRCPGCSAWSLPGHPLTAAAVAGW